jgi:hypothetical protein
LKEMRAAARATNPLDDEKRMMWSSALGSECDGWPPLLAKLFRSTPGVALARGEAGAAPAEITEADWDDARGHLARLCKGDSEAIAKVGKAFPSAAEYRELWSRCSLEELQLMSVRELIIDRPMTLLLHLVYASLRAGSMGHALARMLTRTWLPSEPWPLSFPSYKIQLPRSRSASALLEGIEVLVNHEAVFVRSQSVASLVKGRLPESAKRDGAAGFFVDALFKALQPMAWQLGNLTPGQGPPFPGILTLAMNGDLPVRTLKEIVYSAAEAGFPRIQLIVIHPEERNKMLLLDQSTPGPGTPGSQAPTLSLSLSAYEVKMGKETHRVSTVAGEASSARERLTALLAKIHQDSVRPERTPASTEGLIHVVAADTLTVQDLVDALDTAREAPGPTRTEPCHLVFDRARQIFHIPEAARPSCLYPYPRLAVLTP